MRLSLVPLVLILNAAPVWAAPGLAVRPDARPGSYDDIQTVEELIPELNSLQCSARCDGQPACGQFKDMDTCIDLGEANGCFWACD